MDHHADAERADFDEGAPPPATAALAAAVPDWMETGLAKAGAQVTVTAQQAYTLRAVRMDLPLVIIPLAGSKRVELGAASTDIGCGQFLMIHEVASMHVENRPAADGSDYRAWIVPFPWRIVELARTLLAAYPAPPLPSLPEAQADRSRPWSSGAIAPLLPALGHLLDALTAEGTPDAALIDHGVLGVLLALARHGHDAFLRASDPSLGARIRLLVASAPARDWSSADFEEQLHVSGATLRRKLAEENTSLRMLLREARLHHGLALLQSSRKPLKAIAQACGYRSLPSFNRNFVARFGIEPSAVANGL